MNTVIKQFLSNTFNFLVISELMWRTVKSILHSPLLGRAMLLHTETLLSPFCHWHLSMKRAKTILARAFAEERSIYIALYCIVLYCIVLYCIVSYRIVSYRIVSYRIVSYRIVSYRIVSYRIISYRTVHYITLHFIIHQSILYELLSNLIGLLLLYYDFISH